MKTTQTTKRFAAKFKGRKVLVTVPPSACQCCGGPGCAFCAYTGESK